MAFEPLRCPNRQRPAPEVIKLAYIANIGDYPLREAAFKYFTDLTESFTRTRNLLRSNGLVAENCTANTTAGAVLAIKDVLDHLQARAGARAAVAAEKESLEAAKSPLDRETDANGRVCLSVC